jgi:hypothetical protein
MTPRRTFWEFSAATMWVAWVIIVKVLRFFGVDPLMWNGRVILLGALVLPILDHYGLLSPDGSAAIFVLLFGVAWMIAAIVDGANARQRRRH